MRNLWKLDSRIREAGFIAIMAACIAMCALLGWIGRFMGDELSFTVFYVISVMLSAWYAGKTGGIIISVFAASSRLAGDLTGSRSYSIAVIPINAGKHAKEGIKKGCPFLTNRRYHI